MIGEGIPIVFDGRRVVALTCAVTYGPTRAHSIFFGSTAAVYAYYPWWAQVFTVAAFAWLGWCGLRDPKHLRESAFVAFVAAGMSVGLLYLGSPGTAGWVNATGQAAMLAWLIWHSARWR